MSMETELGAAAEIARDTIHDRAMKERDPEGWIGWTALSTMAMALLSAIAALLAGFTANDAILTRTEAIVETVDRDRDQLRIAILNTREELLRALGKDVADDAGIDPEQRRIGVATEQVAGLDAETAADEAAVEGAMQKHELFAIGVTLLSIAITLSGMAVVSKRPVLWHIGLVVSVAGASTVGYGIVSMLSA